MSGITDQIIKTIENLSGDYSGYEIFTDWIKASAIAISNATDMITDEITKRRESEYMDIVKKHGSEKIKRFADMTGMLAITLENDMRDVLGEIYMKAGLGSKETGQFFTPFHLSYMTAKLMEFKDEVCEMEEPSSGGGGMIIAAAKVMKDRGMNYQKLLRVTARDLDWKGVYMTYVQLSLLGIRARVIQGDTLSDKATIPQQVYYTPKWKGVIL